MTLLLSLFACADVKDTGVVDDDNHDVVTRVELELTPGGDGDLIVASWSDPEMNGDPVIEELSLAFGESYGLSVRFFNDLVDPAEELTSEVEEAGDEHQIFFTGLVRGPATGDVQGLIEHSYTDEDSSGLPVGLENLAIGNDIGQGELILTLRHMPPVGDEPAKVAGLAELLADQGFVALPGDNDVQVSFPVEVLGE